MTAKNPRMKTAGRQYKRGRDAVPSLALAVVQAGAAENSFIGLLTVPGYDPSEYIVVMTDNEGGKYKFSTNQLLAGATPTVAGTDTISGYIQIIANRAIANWTAEVTVVGTVEDFSTTIIPFRKNLLATGSLLTKFQSIPDGNTITVLKTADNSGELTSGPLYVAGTNVMPAPSVTYNGLVSTGYLDWDDDGVARVVPPAAESRVTAKPILAMLTVPRQRFAVGTNLVIMVAAEEHHQFEVSKVRGYCEGAFLDVSEKKWYFYFDANNRHKWFYGYIFELDASNYTAFSTNKLRRVRVYFRAYAQDGTMQTQLIGDDTAENLQYIFNPATAIHGSLIEVTPSGVASQAGGAYPDVDAVFTTLEDAQRYAAGKTIQGFTMSAGKIGDAPLIEVTEDCTLTPLNVAGLGTSSVYNDGAGYCTITAASGVNEVIIGRPGPWDTTTSAPFNIANHAWRVAYGATEFRGQAIVFDNDFWSNFNYASGNTQYFHWWNGVRNRCSWNMLHQYSEFGLTRRAGSPTYKTDCIIAGCSGQSALICRNNEYPYGPGGDFYNNTRAIYGDVCHDWDISDMRVVQDGFTIMYDGGAGTPSWNKTLNNGVAGSTFNLRLNGSIIPNGTFTTTNKLIHELVEWINTNHGASGWTAVSLVTDNDRETDISAQYIASSDPADPGVASTTGTYITAHTVTMVPNVASTVRTFNDIHCDLYQFFGGQNNRYMESVRIFRAYTAQSIFVDANSTDCYFGNVFIENNPGNAKAQITDKVHSHLIFRNFADPNITLYLNNTGVYNADIYCETSGMMFNYLQWQTAGSNNIRPVLRYSHFNSPYADTGTQVSVDVTSGGTALTNYPNVADRDARPAGTLLANPAISPYSKIDAQGLDRNVLDTTKGPTTVGLSGTITKAQALELAYAHCNDNTGANISSISFSYMDGAGETGDLQVFVVNITAEAA